MDIHIFNKYFLSICTRIVLGITGEKKCDLSLLLFSHLAVSDSATHGPAHQASFSFTVSHSLLKFMFTESVVLSNHLIFCCPPFAFNLSQHLGLFQSVSSLHQVGQSIGTSAPGLPMNIQGWFPLGLTGLISIHGLLWSGLGNFLTLAHKKSGVYQ